MSNQVLREILKWSKSRAIWQRDALRRLLNGDLSSQDLDELILLCKEEVGLDPGAAPKPIPLDANHVGKVDASPEAVTIEKIHQVHEVNALHDNAALALSNEGVTGIFGANGSGKTGFTRILKNACRCLDASSSNVLPNVFGNGGNPRALIEYWVGTDKRKFDWSPEGDCPGELKAINVYDRKCGSVYVTEENEAAYVPFGLHLLTNLAAACKEVQARLKEEHGSSLSKLPNAPPSHEGTDEMSWLDSLGAGTTDAEIESWTAFGTAEEEELHRCERALAHEKPKARIKELAAKQHRIGRLKDRLEYLLSALDERAEKEHRRLGEEVVRAEEARDIAARSLRMAELPGTGSDPWRSLWISARQYVEQVAYPGKRFPSDEEIDRCALCQQKLSDEAKERLADFDRFVNDAAAVTFDRTLQAFDTARRTLEDLPIASSDETLLAELPADTADSVRDFLSAMDRRRATLLEASPSGRINLPSLPNEPPFRQLQMAWERLDEETAAFEMAGQAHEREAMERKVHSLKARRFLNDNVSAIRQEVERLKLLDQLEKAIKLTNPSAVSRKSGDLTRKYVTEAHKERFRARLQDLLGDKKVVSLEKTRASLGTTYFRIRLNEATTSANVADVVSEGEFRAIGLAAFLAELDQEPARSAVVFDDPVTSMDHRYRDKVATVLVKLAKERQVVVFTHDLFFLSCLLRDAKGLRVPWSTLEVIGIAGSYGYSANKVPIEIQTLKQRRKSMNKKIQDARSALARSDVSTYQSKAFEIAREMRLAIERSVEEVLFHGAVCRFDKDVHTKKLSSTLTGIKQADIDFIVELMDRYSPFFHDQPVDAATPPPDIGDLKRDLQKLSDWAHEFERRKPETAA